MRMRILARDVAMRAVFRGDGALSSDRAQSNGVQVTSSSSSSSSSSNGFVEFFRQASPYIALHRGSTFVVLIPGDVSASTAKMKSVVRDVSLLHDLGVRIVLVVGASDQVSELTKMRGGEVNFVDD